MNVSKLGDGRVVISQEDLDRLIKSHEHVLTAPDCEDMRGFMEETCELAEEAKAAEADAWKPKLSGDYTSAEKCVNFEKLHHMALDHYHTRLVGGRTKDFERYFYETVMELLGKDVWKVLNNHPAVE